MALRFHPYSKDLATIESSLYKSGSGELFNTLKHFHETDSCACLQ